MAALRFGLAVVAAILFVYAGTEMRDLESIAGNSVAEAFYQAMGLFSYGLAALALAIGIPAGLSLRTLTSGVDLVEGTALPRKDPFRSTRGEEKSEE